MRPIDRLKAALPPEALKPLDVQHVGRGWDGDKSRNATDAEKRGLRMDVVRGVAGAAGTA